MSSISCQHFQYRIREGQIFLVSLLCQWGVCLVPSQSRTHTTSQFLRNPASIINKILSVRKSMSPFISMQQPTCKNLTAGICLFATTMRTGLPKTSSELCTNAIPVLAACFTDSSDNWETPNSWRHL